MVYYKNNLIINIPFLVCSFLVIPFASGYRVGQAIALMIALDRFTAIYRPLIYNRLQNRVGLLKFFISFLKKVTSFCALICFLIICGLVFLIFYNQDFYSWQNLYACTSPISKTYYTIATSYSGVVSSLFFGKHILKLDPFQSFIYQVSPFYTDNLVSTKKSKFMRRKIYQKFK